MQVSINNEEFKLTYDWKTNAPFPDLYIFLENVQNHKIALVFKHQTVIDHFFDYNNLEVSKDLCASKVKQIVYDNWPIFEKMASRELMKTEVQKEIQRPNLKIHHIPVIPSDFQNENFRN